MGTTPQPSLAHRYPMLLIDRVVTIEPGNRIVAVKAVTRNEPWYAGTALDSDERRVAYPRTLLLESWVQAAGLLLTTADAGSDRVMLLGAISGVGYGDPVLPGDLVEHHARLVREVADTAIIEGHSLVGTTGVLTVRQAVVTMRPRMELRVPEYGSPAARQGSDPTSVGASVDR
ncbi:3-hydroxyacyl-ACP dehydratase FabZ family protein [Micromonospora sp. NBC_01796]|uniref:3-hydroxyacyl-ACP dehydratase FabZ family protein n=1 Tax=Micromonospora sp. NBC_01796 TaxID=2975987 RepID=UPI002DDA0F74|nr:beta-hydroxyacyl-ACP dehydratase [Micromonospora sp. NBC_01796]WSA85940.1 beta-hydroxyacyl-ACP dehydratase [Micromonospora sp. NBC_01796]